MIGSTGTKIPSKIPQLLLAVQNRRPENKLLSKAELSLKLGSIYALRKRQKICFRDIKQESFKNC